MDIANQRLQHQFLAGRRLESPVEVVQRLGAVQAQDYAAAKWGVGQRTVGVTSAALDQALNAGTILRTHVLRPTWHFVDPADIRWMLALTAPRVKAVLASYNRKLELDEAAFQRSNAALAEALQGGQELTRAELATVLEKAGIDPYAELRLNHILINAELDGVMCSGALRGKQHTYALLDERAPQARVLEREAALAELAERYFTGHGPATVKDFIWWSGLSPADARAGLDLAKPRLEHEEQGGQRYWWGADLPAAIDPSPTVYLLPNYDEFIVGYTDRGAVLDPALNQLSSRGAILFSHTLVIDGQVAGVWKRTLRKREVSIEFTTNALLSAAERRALDAAAQRFGHFLDLPVVLQE